jgi:hypothetical protein
MKSASKTDLHKSFQKVLDTPASFEFFVAIHDFVESLENDPAFSGGFLRRKANSDLAIPTKYGYLKQIHQGLEDAAKSSAGDIGHDRYSVLRDLTKIKNKETNDSNMFWKKRELFRKLAAEVHERFTVRVS